MTRQWCPRRECSQKPLKQQVWSIKDQTVPTNTAYPPTTLKTKGVLLDVLQSSNYKLAFKYCCLRVWKGTQQEIPKGRALGPRMSCSYSSTRSGPQGNCSILKTAPTHDWQPRPLLLEQSTQKGLLYLSLHFGERAGALLTVWHPMNFFPLLAKYCSAETNQLLPSHADRGKKGSSKPSAKGTALHSELVLLTVNKNPILCPAKNHRNKQRDFCLLWTTIRQNQHNLLTFFLKLL